MRVPQRCRTLGKRTLHSETVHRESLESLITLHCIFSDEEMKQRDPLLYEQMVGQYLNEDEINDMVDKADLRFSSILTKHMDVLQSNIIYGIQKELEVNDSFFVWFFFNFLFFFYEY